MKSKPTWPDSFGSNHVGFSCFSLRWILDLTRAFRGLDLMQAFARSIVETVRHPLLVLDVGLKVVVANPSFYRTFGTTESATEGNDFFVIDGGRWDQPRLRTLLKEVIPRDGLFKDVEVEYECRPSGAARDGPQRSPGGPRRRRHPDDSSGH